MNVHKTARFVLLPAASAAFSTGTITPVIPLEVIGPVYCHGVHIEDGGHEVLADNYFDLLPGVPRHIPITAPSASGTYALTAVMPIGSKTR